MGCRFGKRKKKNLSHQIQMLMSSPHCFKLMIGPCLFFCWFFFFPFGVGEFRLVVPLDVLKRGEGGLYKIGSKCHCHEKKKTLLYTRSCFSKWELNASLFMCLLSLKAQIANSNFWKEIRSHSKTSSSREITLCADIPQVTDGLSRQKNTFPNLFVLVFSLRP